MSPSIAQALPRRPWARAAAAFAALSALTSAAMPLRAQPASAPSVIYTCTDDHGRRITSDRLIAECVDREQRILNRDGSLRAIQPPSLTADERAAKEARDRKAAEARAAQADAVRRDRNLLARFPDETAHQRAREAALDTVREAMRSSALRMNTLDAERKPLLTEAEFYAGKPLPAPLKAQLDANDAAAEAQRAAMRTQEAELERINGLYDSELARLRRLWAGAAPGSMGPMAAAGGPKAAKP